MFILKPHMLRGILTDWNKSSRWVSGVWNVICMSSNRRTYTALPLEKWRLGPNISNCLNISKGWYTEEETVIASRDAVGGVQARESSNTKGTWPLPIHCSRIHRTRHLKDGLPGFAWTLALAQCKFTIPRTPSSMLENRTEDISF